MTCFNHLFSFSRIMFADYGLRLSVTCHRSTVTESPRQYRNPSCEPQYILPPTTNGVALMLAPVGNDHSKSPSIDRQYHFPLREPTTIAESLTHGELHIPPSVLNFHITFPESAVRQ